MDNEMTEGEMLYTVLKFLLRRMSAAYIVQLKDGTELESETPVKLAAPEPEPEPEPQPRRPKRKQRPGLREKVVAEVRKMPLNRWKDFKASDFSEFNVSTVVLQRAFCGVGHCRATEAEGLKVRTRVDEDRDVVEVMRTH